MVTMKDGTEVEWGGFGRLVHFDEQSREYPVRRELLKREVTDRLPAPKSHSWEQSRGNYYLEAADQGDIGSCVSDGIATACLLRPHPIILNLRERIDRAFRLAAYCAAQRRDPWAGTDAPAVCGRLADAPHYGGTATLAGLLEYRNRGFFKEFLWAFGINEAVVGVGHHSPAVTGTWWHGDMSRPDSSGKIKVGGGREGGHLYCISGVDVSGVNDMLDGEVQILNTWGPEWGDKGRARMSIRDWARLLDDEGECAFIRGGVVRPPSILPDTEGGRV